MNLIKQILFLPLASLFIITVASAYAKQKPLKEKENPNLVGERDINKRQVNIYTFEKEIELGRKLAAEVEKRSELISDAVVQDAINRITQTIALNSDCKMLITVKVINSPDVSAFSL